MPDTLEEILARLRDEISAKQEDVRAKLAECLQREDDQNPSDEETAWLDTRMGEIEAQQKRVEQIAAQLERERTAKATIERLGTSPAVVTREDGPYTRASSMNHGPSYFRDLWLSKRGDRDALDRLQRNNTAVATEKAKTRTGISTVTGAGGEFVPPLWLENEFVPLARPGRVFADLVTKDALPPGTDSINIPKVNTGTAVALQGYPQGGQNTGIQETDIATTSVSAGVFTVAGGQTVSMQLIEQSPINVDRVILEDLAKAYAIQLDQFTLYGTGTNQPTGVLNQGGINSITVSGASAPTISQLYTALAQAVSNITKRRFMRPTAIVMHEMRWAWLLSQLDTQNRPLFVPEGGNFNPLGVTSADRATAAEGPVGATMGLPIYVDANMPTNLGSGTNQDAIIVLKADDVWLWEGQVKAEAFEQTYAQQLSLFIRLYGYMAFQAGRYAPSISTITGTAFQSTYLSGF